MAGIARGRDNEQIIRLNLLRALQLHRRLAFAFALIGLLLAAAYAILQWPVYTVRARIYVRPGFAAQSHVIGQRPKLFSQCGCL